MGQRTCFGLLHGIPHHHCPVHYKVQRGGLRAHNLLVTALRGVYLHFAVVLSFPKATRRPQSCLCTSPCSFEACCLEFRIPRLDSRTGRRRFDRVDRCPALGAPAADIDTTSHTNTQVSESQRRNPDTPYSASPSFSIHMKPCTGLLRDIISR